LQGEIKVIFPKRRRQKKRLQKEMKFIIKIRQTTPKRRRWLFEKKINLRRQISIKLIQKKQTIGIRR
jgi:hypothetical protein